jgi:hypothetical protein
MTALPPCCAELEEPPCPQHVQHARLVLRDGPRARGGRKSPVIGLPGNAEPAPEPEDP